MSEITAAIKRLVQRNGQFNGKGVSHYLRDYKTEMLRYGISKRLQVISFNRVATDELQESIHKIRQQNPTWGSFEEALRETEGTRSARVRRMGGIGEDPPKCNASIPRVRASFFLTLGARTTIGGGGQSSDVPYIDRSQIKHGHRDRT